MFKNAREKNTVSRLIAVFMTLSILLSSGYPAVENYTTQTEAGEFLKVLLRKNEITSEYHTGEKSTYTWNETDSYTLDYGTTLQKASDRDFVILNIADIHFSDFGYRVFFSVFAEATLKQLVAETQPDLILLSGDNVCGESTYYSIRHLTDLMESFGIPWAPVFGNHDDEGNCDLNFLADVMMKAPHCLFKKGDERMGSGNYVINIAEGDKVCETIVMMDSHHSQANELQQSWYKWVCEGTQRVTGGTSEVTLVQHIPLPEYQYAYDKSYSAGVWTDNGFGELNEKICCERDGDGNPVQRGFFDVIKATGNTEYIFCGHEHMNDFSVDYDGIRLTYCMKIGKNSGYQPGFDGGTVITAGSDGLTSITHLTKSATGFKALEIINLK